MRGRSATPGVWMKPTSKLKGNGSTSIAPSISRGRTVDFLLSKRRDVAAAKRFFSRAAKQHGAPRVITLDGYAASHRAVAKLKEVGTLPAPRTGAILQVFEQRGRARSSPDKAANRSRCSDSSDSRRRP